MPARPAWAADLIEVFADVVPVDAGPRLVPDGVTGRPAAVLILLAEGPHGPDILLTERSADLRSHAGQPAFPGGATDPEDASPVETALREAREEVGLDADSVEVLATGPTLYLPPSNFLVTPVLAWWREPGPVAPVDPAETAAVARVPVSELTDPANRVLCRSPRTGYIGPAFEVSGLLVWGFTAMLLDSLLRVAGWERPWLPGREVELREPRGPRVEIDRAGDWDGDRPPADEGPATGGTATADRLDRPRTGDSLDD